jgi:hypothetical protein
MNLLLMQEKIDEIEMIERNNFLNLQLQNERQIQMIDRLGHAQISVIQKFDEFSKTFEKVRGEVIFKNKFEKITDKTIPKFDFNEIKEVSLGATPLQKIIKSCAVGAAGSLAIGGIVYSAIAVNGKDIAGNSIAAMSGTTALAALMPTLGGGVLSQGSMAFAVSMPLFGLTGILGSLFSIAVGLSQDKKIDEAHREVLTQREAVNKICEYMQELGESASLYTNAINKTNNVLTRKLSDFRYTVNFLRKTEADQFSEKELVNMQNIILLVTLLNEMCKVKLVLKSKNENEIQPINHEEIEKQITESNRTLKTIQSSANNYFY